MGDWYVFLVAGWLVAALASAVLGGWVAEQKGRAEGEGVVLGLLFGPLGVMVEGMLPNRL